jgi:predicted DNA-binding antitoxin AbrB/MazE fold protein
MTVVSTRTIEAAYENGLLRPLEPIQDSDNQVYLVTILNLDTFRAKTLPQQIKGLRGKYRGYLSRADEFARGKQTEKALEL